MRIKDAGRNFLDLIKYHTLGEKSLVFTGFKKENFRPYIFRAMIELRREITDSSSSCKTTTLIFEAFIV